MAPAVVLNSPHIEDHPSGTDQQGTEDSMITNTQEHGKPLSDSSSSKHSKRSASTGPSRKKATMATLGKETVIKAMKLSTVVGDTIKTAA